MINNLLLEDLMRSNLVFSQRWCAATLQTPVICPKLKIRFLLSGQFYTPLSIPVVDKHNGNADDEFRFTAGPPYWSKSSLDTILMKMTILVMKMVMLMMMMMTCFSTITSWTKYPEGTKPGSHCTTQCSSPSFLFNLCKFIPITIHLFAQLVQI